MSSTVLAALIAGIAGIIAALISALGAQVFIYLTKKKEIAVTNPPKPYSTKKRKPPAKSKSKIPVAILLPAVIGGVIGVVLGYFLIAIPFAISSCSPFAPTSAPIVSPTPNSKVPQSLLVQGTACNIPADKKLWLLVAAGGVPGYYPQNSGPIVPSSDGKWTASASLGGKDSFVLYTALADQKSEAVLQNYFKSAPNFRPLDPLPPGIQLMSQLLVET